MDSNKGIFLPGESSKGQTVPINTPASISDAVPVDLSNIQINVLVSNPEAISPISGPSTPRLEEDHTTEPITNTHPENDGSDSTSDDESVASEEPEEVKEWRRKLAHYKDLYERTYGKKYDQEAEKGKGKGKRTADDDTAKETKNEGKKKKKQRKIDRTVSSMSPEGKLKYHHSVLKRHFEEAMEKGNMLGYAYGIVLEDDTVLTGCSESLRKWWEETVQFKQLGPAAANKYIIESQAKLLRVNDNEAPQRSYDLLMRLSDGTLGSVLSSLMWECEPPQREFPFKNGTAPPWWPRGDEIWWGETGEERPGKGELEYRKPHDVKKRWKAVVVLAVMKHLAPRFGVMVRSVKASRNVQDRLTMREMDAWNLAVREEMKVYCETHTDVPLSELLKAFRFHRDVKQKRALLTVENNYNRTREERSRNRNGNRNRNVPLFPCENKDYVHNQTDFAFRNAAARDIHRPTCKHKPQKNPTSTPAPTELQPIFEAPDQQIFEAPSQPLTAPVESSLLELIRQINPETNSPHQDWNPSDNAGVSISNSSYDQSAPSGSCLGGYYYSGPGSSSTGGANDDNGLGRCIGLYLRMLNDADYPSIYQQQQLYEEDHPSVQHALFDHYRAHREGLLSEAIQQQTKTQLFFDDRAVETGCSDMQMINDRLPEAEQFGQIDPINDFLAPSQPYPPVAPNYIGISPATDLHQSAPQDVLNPAPSEDDEHWPNWSFFQ